MLGESVYRTDARSTRQRPRKWSPPSWQRQDNDQAQSPRWSPRARLSPPHLSPFSISSSEGIWGDWSSFLFQVFKNRNSSIVIKTTLILTQCFLGPAQP